MLFRMKNRSYTRICNVLYFVTRMTRWWFYEVNSRGLRHARSRPGPFPRRHWLILSRQISQFGALSKRAPTFYPAILIEGALSFWDRYPSWLISNARIRSTVYRPLSGCPPASSILRAGSEEHNYRVIKYSVAVGYQRVLRSRPLT